MTTPRDAIAGLSEEPGRVDRALSLHLLKEREALRNEINDWANEVARYKSYAEKFDQENDALQARVKELEAELANVGPAVIQIRNELDRVRVDRDSWKDQFESASAAASEYSEFWERHSGEFDAGGNYIPHSQIDGDLRAAESRASRLQQERDAAYERAAKAAWKAIDPSTEGVARECAEQAVAAIRRLAGPEKEGK